MHAEAQAKYEGLIQAMELAESGELCLDQDLFEALGEMISPLVKDLDRYKRGLDGEKKEVKHGETFSFGGAVFKVVRGAKRANQRKAFEVAHATLAGLSPDAAAEVDKIIEDQCTTYDKKLERLS